MATRLTQTIAAGLTATTLFSAQVANAQGFEITREKLDQTVKSYCATKGELEGECVEHSHGRDKVTARILIANACFTKVVEAEATRLYKTRKNEALYKLFDGVSQCERSFFRPNANNAFGHVALDLGNEAFFDSQNARFGTYKDMKWKPGNPQF